MKEFSTFTSRITLQLPNASFKCTPGHTELHNLSSAHYNFFVSAKVWKAFLPAPAEFSLSSDDGGQNPNELMPGRKGALLSSRSE